MKTVRVRIAVAVNEKGSWTSFGWGSLPPVHTPSDDQEFGNMALDSLPQSGAESVHYIEADVPLPAPQTIEGKVTT